LIFCSLESDALRKGPPSIDTEALNKLVGSAPKVFETLQEMSGDPSMLQSTVDEARREIKNIVKPIPEGLQTLKYKVLSRKSRFEIREYDSYSICTTEESMEAGRSFNVLADYIFGNANESGEKLSMTTPVITQMQEVGAGVDRMSFILSDGKTSADAPAPTDSRVKVTDVPVEVVAYMEFPGIATEKEAKLQSRLLEDYLQKEGVDFDKASLKVFQYNPPYTLPWLRTNAITFRITGSFFSDDTPVRDNEKGKGKDDDSEEGGYTSSPEAGDQE
jgi:hypothetical protein